MTSYARKFDEKTTMSFKVNNEQILMNHRKKLGKTEKLMKIDFETKPIYGDDDKYIKTKIKQYAESIITNFHNKIMPQEKGPCKCLSIITLDSIIKAIKKLKLRTILMKI